MFWMSCSIYELFFFLMKSSIYELVLTPLRYFIIILWFICFQVVNDLLNPAGQNLRIREDAQVQIIILCFL